MTAVIVTTRTKGTMVVNHVKEEISGISCKIRRKRKYAFATLWNCSNKLIGKKVRILYLDVWIRLSLNVNGLNAPTKRLKLAQ